ncbi:MAG TPA: NAD(P)-binding domain-containing protein [Terriglobales bacterium]|nr:NAD(P)-binding domain-containing protein [Terriglobales bacterium]
MRSGDNLTRTQTIVIGGGQAGLAVGYHLAKRGLRFEILDANQRVGDAWRRRWDSLRLFTPARYAGLPGMRFPARGDWFPTKEEVADYLGDYARHFRLPVRNGVRVDRLWKEDGRFLLSAGRQRFESDNVIVAMANYQVPRMPAFARELRPDITQLHSHDYRNASQLQEGGVLVVGVGNSGADIGIEVAQSHPTWMSGQESGHIPWPIETFVARNFVIRLVRLFGHHILSMKTPIGRKLRPKMLHLTAPLVRVKPKDLSNAGIKRVPRVIGTREGLPLLADGRVCDVRNVIWCTGFEHGFPWIDLGIFDANGDPIHESGIVTEVPGMYFVGLHFLYSMTSATLTGVGRDAERIVRALAARTQHLASASAPRPSAAQMQAFDKLATATRDVPVA